MSCSVMAMSTNLQGRLALPQRLVVLPYDSAEVQLRYWGTAAPWGQLGWSKGVRVAP